MAERSKVILAVTIILVSLGIVGGALLYSQQESRPRGLMQRSTPRGACTLQWSPDKLPMLIHLPEEAGLDWRVAAAAAVAEWNSLTGLQLVELSTVESASDVKGIWHNAGEYKPSDELFQYRRVGEGQCIIEQGDWHFPGLLPPEGRQRWLMHGIGHFLGLDHDNISDSVMNGAPLHFYAPFQVPPEYPALLKTLYQDHAAAFGKGLSND